MKIVPAPSTGLPGDNIPKLTTRGLEHIHPLENKFSVGRKYGCLCICESEKVSYKSGPKVILCEKKC